MQILETIADTWGWRGLRPKTLVMQNEFGNVIVTDECGQYWRVCPEELSCEMLATDGSDFARVQNTDAFQQDWTMAALVKEAHATLGAPAATQCYCLKILATSAAFTRAINFGTIDRAELIAFAGDLAQQIDWRAGQVENDASLNPLLGRARRARPHR